MAKGTCSVASCVHPAQTRGWCSLHYSRWRRHGDPLTAFRPNGRASQEPCTCRTPEEWRSIPGYEGVYDASDHGRIRSLSRVIYPRAGSPRPICGRIMKLGVGDKGHLIVCLKGALSGRQFFLAHRLVLVTFVGPCPPDMEGCHNDGNPGNNHLDNLRWDTSTANHYDMVKHGTHCNASKKVCKYGHRLELPNLVKYKLPWRGCRSCAMSRSKVDSERRLYGRELDFLETAHLIYATRLDPERFPVVTAA